MSAPLSAKSLTLRVPFLGSWCIPIQAFFDIPILVPLETILRRWAHVLFVVPKKRRLPGLMLAVMDSCKSSPNRIPNGYCAFFHKVPSRL
jgi:hypothetical protein